MTSQLRRNRPTTAWSIRPAKTADGTALAGGGRAVSPRRWRLQGIGLATLLLACWPLAPVRAAEPFRTVETRTTGDAARLKWLPHRPTGPVQGLRPLSEHHAAKLPTRLTQHSDSGPFSDPFGDAADNAAGLPQGPGLIPLSPPGGYSPGMENATGRDPAYPSLMPGTEPAGKPGVADMPLARERTLTLAEELGTRAPD
ncbi:MAG: hypothetical protein U1E05_09925, partial [Patescibacteria group bacterium]|nr:hypothetical protein [Patescibacteria group bacterium]